MPHAVMIFSAGFGTRMMPLTADRPKPMVPVAGRPLIDHALDLARTVQPDRIVANLHYKPEILQQHLADTEVQTTVETPDILDTGGGLRNALPLLGDGPVWTMNPDVIYRGPNPLTLLRDHWNPDRMDALLLCVDPANAHGTASTGDFGLAPDGTLTRGPGVIYASTQIIKPELTDTVPNKVFSLNLLWDDLIAKQRCFGIRYPGEWCDIGHPGGIPLAEALLDV